MEIYADKAQDKVVIVADSYELHLLHSAQWWAMDHWFKKANKDGKDSQEYELDMQIADAHSSIGQALANTDALMNKDKTE